MRDGALALGTPFRSREVAPGRLAGLFYLVESPTWADCYLQPVDKDAAGSAMRMSILSEPALCGVLLSELCGSVSEWISGSDDAGRGAAVCTKIEARAAIRLDVRADRNGRKVGICAVEKPGIARRNLAPLDFRDGPRTAGGTHLSVRARFIADPSGSARPDQIFRLTVSE
jgi:hypothetical protein